MVVEERPIVWPVIKESVMCDCGTDCFRDVLSPHLLIIRTHRLNIIRIVTEFNVYLAIILTGRLQNENVLPTSSSSNNKYI